MKMRQMQVCVLKMLPDAVAVNPAGSDVGMLQAKHAQSYLGLHGCQHS